MGFICETLRIESNTRSNSKWGPMHTWAKEKNYSSLFGTSHFGDTACSWVNGIAWDWAYINNYKMLKNVGFGDVLCDHMNTVWHKVKFKMRYYMYMGKGEKLLKSHRHFSFWRFQALGITLTASQRRGIVLILISEGGYVLRRK